MTWGPKKGSGPSAPGDVMETGGLSQVGRRHVKSSLVCDQMGHLPTAYVELVPPLAW